MAFTVDNLNFDLDFTKEDKNVFGETNAKTYGDTRFYKLKRNEKTKSANAIVRFLPDKNNEYFKQVFRYNINKQKNGEKRWADILSPTSINQNEPCPFKEKWQEEYNKDKNAARSYARSTRYITNILIVNDVLNPENNGKIFLFEVSKSLKDIIQSKIMPTDEELQCGVEPVALLNPAKGYNFLISSKLADNGITSFSSSKEQGKLTGVCYDDEEIATKEIDYKDKKEVEKLKKDLVDIINNHTYELDEFNKRETYKTYEELKQLLDYVTFKTNTQNSVETESQDLEEKSELIEKLENSVSEDSEETENVEKPKKVKKAKVKVEEDSDDLDDLLNSI